MTFRVKGKESSAKTTVPRYRPVHFSLEFNARIKKYADQAGVSKAAFCTQAIEYAIDNMDAE